MRTLLCLLVLLAPACFAQTPYLDANRKLESCENVALAVEVYSSRVQHKEAFRNQVWNWRYPQHMFSAIAMSEFRKLKLEDYEGMRGRKWGWAWCMDNYGRSLPSLSPEEYEDLMAGGAVKKPIKQSLPKAPGK